MTTPRVRRWAASVGFLAVTLLAAATPVFSEPTTAALPAVAPGTTPTDAETPDIYTAARYRLVIRVYDMVGLETSVRAAAIRDAELILRDAHLFATWNDCPRPALERAPSRCADVPDGHELVVRIVREKHPASGVERQVLGYSLLNRVSGDGVLATIYMNRVEWLAADAQTSAVVLLGRAVAHEIGHLVLGTSEHSSSGLMRGVWTSREVRANRPQDWMFSPPDQTRVLDAHLARSQRLETSKPAIEGS